MVEGVEGDAGKGDGRWWLMVMVMLDNGDAMMVMVMVVIVMMIADYKRGGEWRCWLVPAVTVDGAGVEIIVLKTMMMDGG